MLTKDQEYLVDLVLKGHNVYIGGQAGTGKSYLLTHLFDKLTIAGKKVSVTCTTGIACTHFPPRCHASTIHSWAGMDDGRHESSEICDLLQNSVHYKQALHRILHCDVLILDEVSMLSKRLFEQLSTICSLKDGNYCFGNIQLVFSGDFLQLPPVKNSLYNEEGQFCFLSETFQRVFQHTVFLSEIKRQCDSTFIQTINEVSRGILSEDSNKYLSELNRPLDEKDSVKLFATNGLVDKYNRQCILQAKGQLYEYRAEDGGDVQHLSKVLAPPTLWLKKYCPVVLLRNLSDKLVNGLIGKVVSCGDDGPVVNFPSIDVTTKLDKINFSVYSPASKRNLAVRNQIPLKLGYALTIHKSQGMTLERVEVDCQQIFLPGQLGVAIGRCTSVDGLRIINFKDEVCLPHPETVELFCSRTCLAPDPDLKCCRNILREEIVEELMTPFSMDEFLNETADEYGEDEFDNEFNQIILSVDTCVNERTIWDTTLPQGFDVEVIISKLKYDDPLTSIQSEINEIVSCLSLNQQNVEKVIEFCSQEFTIIYEIMKNSNIDTPETSAVSVTPDKLTLFYSKCHQHQTSTAYKARAFLMVDNIPNISPKAVSHIAYQLTVAVRTFVLKEKEAKYPVADRDSHKRTVTTASLGKVRYVGGFCLAKLRYKHQKIQFNKCYKTSSKDQAQYKKSSVITQILDTMRVSETSLQLHTEHPETLLETAQRQNVSRGLTNITDELYKFFIDLCENCLTSLVDKNLNVQGSHIYNISSEKLVQSIELYKKFVDIASSCHVQEFHSESTVDCLLSETVDRICAIEEIYEELVRKFLLVMLNQYRKDFLQTLSVEKKMAHRKQIQVKAKSKALKGSNIDFNFIVNDSEGKSVSHQILKGLILQNSKYLCTFKKKELMSLCKAYNMKIKSTENKDNIIKQLNRQITEIGSAMIKPACLNQSSDPNVSSSSTNTHIEEETTDNVTTPQTRETQLATHTVSSETELEDDICTVCLKKESSSKDWISCDSCSKWFHRNCAGLSNGFKWRRFSKKNVQYICDTCK